MSEVISEPMATKNPLNPDKIETVETLAGEKREREEDEENANEISKKPKVDGDEEATKDKDEEMKEKEENNENETLKKPKVAADDEDEAEEKDEDMKERGYDSANLGPKEDDENEETKETNEGLKEKKEKSAKLGPKQFESGETMFDYFFKLLHHWPPNVDINKYEYMVLLDLLKKGHAEADKKIGSGIKAFQVRYHPIWKSRCFFLVRVDGSSDDFSFRKCVDQILPLPANMKIPSSSNGMNKFDGRKNGGQQRGGGGGGRGRGGGHGNVKKGKFGK